MSTISNKVDNEIKSEEQKKEVKEETIPIGNVTPVEQVVSENTKTVESENKVTEQAKIEPSISEKPVEKVESTPTPTNTPVESQSKVVQESNAIIDDKKTDLKESQVKETKEESIIETQQVKEAKVEEEKADKEENGDVIKEKSKEEVVEPIVKDLNNNPKVDMKAKRSTLPVVEYSDTEDIGIYSFLAVVFIACMAYMVFLIYSQNQKYDFLNYDLNREMNYQLIPDEN
jgi:hypothetical protein